MFQCMCDKCGWSQPVLKTVDVAKRGYDAGIVPCVYVGDICELKSKDKMSQSCARSGISGVSGQPGLLSV